MLRAIIQTTRNDSEILLGSFRPQDYDRARQIYATAIQVVPHKQFTFAKLWIMYAKFELRRMDLPAARKLLGAAIGMCPKERLFKGYIQLELDVSTALLGLAPFAWMFITSLLRSYGNSTALESCTRNTSR